MNSDRRALLARLGLVVLASAALLGAAAWIPDGGLVGALGWVLGFAGATVALSVPVAIWRVVSPDAAARWEADPKGQPTPLLSPVVFWVGTIVFAWILTQVEPPTSLADYGCMAFLWCAAAGAAGFATMFTRMYWRDRRRSTE
jgi:hypothetical protein